MNPRAGLVQRGVAPTPWRNKRAFKLGATLAHPIGEKPSHLLVWLHIALGLMKQATYGMNSQLFVQKYPLDWPDRGSLKREAQA